MITNHKPTQLFYSFYPSSFGKLLIGAYDNTCFWISFVCTTETDALTQLQETYPSCTLQHQPEATLFVCHALEEYKQHKPLSISVAGSGTPFQHAVWNALLSIPFGDTTAYTAIATQIGAPKAVRAVGSAVGKNPISILIPCHRVIRKNGTFHHYRWGKEHKKALLTFEGYFRPKSAGISPQD